MGYDMETHVAVDKETDGRFNKDNFPTYYMPLRFTVKFGMSLGG